MKKRILTTTILLCALAMFCRSEPVPQPNIQFPRMMISNDILVMLEGGYSSLGIAGNEFLSLLHTAFPQSYKTELEAGELIIIDTKGTKVGKIKSSVFSQVDLDVDDAGTKQLLDIMKSHLPKQYAKSKTRIDRLFYQDYANVQSNFLSSPLDVLGEHQVLVSCVVDANENSHTGRTPEQCKKMKMLINESHIRITNFDDEDNHLTLGEAPIPVLDAHGVISFKYKDGGSSTLKFARLPVETEVKDAWLFHQRLGLGVDYYVYLKKPLNQSLVRDAEAGNAEAQYRLALAYTTGKDVVQDYQKAVLWLMKAAKQGHNKSCCNLGFCYTVGRGVAQDKEMAQKWYAMAAEQGDAFAQFNLGLSYQESHNYEKAVEWYQKSAEQGHADALLNLGGCYIYGTGVAQDLKKAIDYYKAAANQGNEMAMFLVGRCYEEGKGVAQDYNKAFKWYLMAAEKGFAEAQYILGYYNAAGQGTIKDMNKAIEWYKKAVKQEHIGAMNNLAWLLATCLNADLRNGKDAVLYAVKACELTEWKDISLLDTLAASYAEAGNFDKAIEYQQKILSAPNYVSSDGERERLKLYIAGNPYRE